MNQSKLLTTKLRLHILLSKEKIWIWLVTIFTFIETRNLRCYYGYTTNKFILQTLLTEQSRCLLKSEFSVCSKNYSFCEETPEEFLDETDVDSCFHRNIFDIFQSQHQMVWVSRGANKKLFAIKLFQFCDLKTQQR